MDSATYLNHLPEADQSLPKHGLTLEKVYSAYKDNPHNPDATYGKYLVHRLENGHKYSSATPELQNQMDADFLKHHQQGKASEKNGHIQVQDLQNFIKSPSTKPLAQELVNHKIKLNNFLLQEHPEHIVDVNGRPHIRLTRGLNTQQEERGHDHALASYADDANPDFGDIKHHQLVPLHNLWYSFDYGPDLKHGVGNEDEFLVSPHKVVYNKDFESSPTRQIAVRNHHSFKASGSLRFKSFRNSLTDEDITLAIAKEPHLAIEHLVKTKDSRLKPHHIDQIVQKEPAAAMLFLSNFLNPRQVDYLFNRDAKMATKHLGSKLLPHHIDKIVKKHPELAAEHLKDQLTSEHINEIVQQHPDVAARELKDKLQPHHIDQIVKNDYKAAEFRLGHTKLLQPHHIDYIVEKDPAYAARYLKDRLHPQNVDYIVKKNPTEAALYLSYDQLQPHHVDYITQTSPQVAARQLDFHPYYRKKYLKKSEEALFEKLEKDSKFKPAPLAQTADTYLNHLPEADQSLPKHGLTLPKVYRSYKNSPHNPDALKLKYLVHRLENGHKYNSATPELQNQMDADFLKHHQQGKASEKNGHIQVQDLQDFIRNPSTKALAKNVVNHKIKLNNFLLQEHPEHIVNINGQPHIRLTRGLSVDRSERGIDHALASYADIPNPPFGGEEPVFHHQLVPLSNVWFSYDYGPIAATSKKMGNEDEFLVSPHRVVYNKDFESSPTRQIAVRKLHKLTPDSIAFKSFRDKLTDEGISDAIDNEDPDLIISHLLKTNSSRLNSNHIAKIVQKHPIAAAEYLKDKLQPHHIDHIVQKAPWSAAKHLKDKLTPEHIDHMVQKDPAAAAYLLKDKLTPEHIDHIVQKDPRSAAQNLKDKLTPEHIDHIVQKKPQIAAEHLKDKLTLEHIDHVFQKDPAAAAYLLKDQLQPHHIDHIVQKEPQIAAAHLRHKLQPHHIDHIVQKHPSVAAAHLKDKLQPHHIDHIVKKHPELAVKHFKHKLQPHHIDHFVQNHPELAVAHFTHQLQPHHIDHFVQNHPELAVAHFTHQLQPHHIDHIVKKDPGYAAYHLKDKLTPEHIDHIVQKDPGAAAAYLRFHPYYQQKYLNKSEEVYFEPLQKGRKDGLKMYGENPTPEQKEHVKWAYDKMPNENWATWTIRHHKQKPADFTPEVKSQLEHFAGSQHFKEIADVRFDKQHDLHTGLGMLRDAENTAINKITKRYAPKPEGATKMLDLGDGLSWWNLNKSMCDEEGRLMGHCGNAGNPKHGDTVLSLRKEHNVNGKKYYEPFATFIKNEDTIGEMKGRANKKPVEKYHKAIAELFKHTKLHPFGGGYNPHENFSPNDFSPELYNEVKQVHPDIAAFRNDDEEGKMGLSDKFVNRVIKEDPHRAAFTFGPRLNSKQIEALRSKIPWLGDRKDFTFNSHLQPHQVDIAQWEEPENAARLLSHKLTPEQIDRIVERRPDSAAEYLPHLLQPHHVDHIVDREPEHAMVLLPKLLQQHHVDKLVKQDPRTAAEALAKHPLLQPHHVDYIVKQEPIHAAQHLKDKLTPEHIDRIVKRTPTSAAEHLKDNLTPEHIDHIVKKEPSAAAQHLKDKLTPEHIDHIIKKDPEYTAVSLKDKLQSHHIDYILQKTPWLATQLKDKLQPHHMDYIVQEDHSFAVERLADKLQPHHIDHIVQKDPLVAAANLADKLTPEHIDHIVQNAPDAAAEDLADKLTPEHIDHIVQRDPLVATKHLKDKLQPHHIDHIVQNAPAAAARYLAHKLQPHDIDHIVKNAHSSAARHLATHPYYQQKYLNKSEQLKSNSSLNLIGEKFDISALINQDYSDF